MKVVQERSTLKLTEMNSKLLSINENDEPMQFIKRATLRNEREHVNSEELGPQLEKIEAEVAEPVIDDLAQIVVKFDDFVDHVEIRDNINWLE